MTRNELIKRIKLELLLISEVESYEISGNVQIDPEKEKIWNNIVIRIRCK